MRRLCLSNKTRPSISANNVQSRPVPTFSPAMNFEPRCRTSMLPAVTCCPPNSFTPNRLLTLSRPLRTLPCPFLCAIVSPLSFDFLYFDNGQLLAMTHLMMITFAPFHLKRNRFHTANVFDHIRQHRRLPDGGRADGRFAFV